MSRDCPSNQSQESRQNYINSEHTHTHNGYVNEAPVDIFCNMSILTANFIQMNICGEIMWESFNQNNENIRSGK